jgi:hypothetical protein
VELIHAAAVLRAEAGLGFVVGIVGRGLRARSAL